MAHPIGRSPSPIVLVSHRVPLCLLRLLVTFHWILSFKHFRAAKQGNLQSQRRETGQEKELERRDLARENANEPSCGHELNMFRTVELPGINVMQTDGHWEVIDQAVVSGGQRAWYASSHRRVSAPRKAQRAKKRHRVRSRERRGKQFQRVTRDAVSTQIAAQVCDVNKPCQAPQRSWILMSRRVFFRSEGVL